MVVLSGMSLYQQEVALIKSARVKVFTYKLIVGVLKTSFQDKGNPAKHRRGSRMRTGMNGDPDNWLWERVSVMQW